MPTPLVTHALRVALLPLGITSSLLVSVGTAQDVREQQSVPAMRERPRESQWLKDTTPTINGLHRRRDLGSPVTTLDVDSLMQHTSAATLTELLATRIPGLVVERTTGAPGDPSRLRMRGVTSVFRGNDPVIIVDGSRIYSGQSEARGGNLTNLDPVEGGRTRIYGMDVPAPSPLDQIDPYAVERIDVLRGPSAATLYGADAANGVILITTKRGRVGSTRWSVNLRQGRTSVPTVYPNGSYRWGQESGTPAVCPIFVTSCVQDSLVRFQALNDEALTPFANGRRSTLSLLAAGGTAAVTYSVAASYDEERGALRLPNIEVARFRDAFGRDPEDWMQRPHELKNWGVTSRVGITLSRTAVATLSARVGRVEQQRSSLERQIMPLMGTYADAANEIYMRANPVVDYAMTPASALVSDYFVRQNASAITVSNGLALEWRPSSWFTARSRAGLDLVTRNDLLMRPANLATATDSGARIRAAGRSLVGDFGLAGEFQKSLGSDHRLTTSVGSNLIFTQIDDQVNSANQLASGLTGLGGATQLFATDFGQRMSTYGLWVEPRFSGPTFSVGVGVRLDGADVYDRGSDWEMLPKMDASYLVSNESWFPRSFQKLFSTLRLRGAYGRVPGRLWGTDHLRLYTDSVTAGGAQLRLRTAGNGELEPELSTEFEAGADAELFNGALSVELTGYQKMQTNVLFPVLLPPSVLASGSVLENVGRVRNRGVELVVGATPIRSSQVTWGGRILYSRNANMLRALGAGVRPDTAAGLVVGHPLHGYWARPITTFADQNEDGVLQPSEVEVASTYRYVGQAQPKYTMALFSDIALFDGMVGISTGFSYEDGATQVDRTAQANWVLQQALAEPNAPLDAQAAAIAMRSDIGAMQRIATLRFTSFSVRYRAPSALAHLVRAQQLVVALQGENLGVRSTYNGRDPAVSGWGSGERYGDVGQLPRPRLWQVALRLSY